METLVLRGDEMTPAKWGLIAIARALGLPIAEETPAQRRRLPYLRVPEEPGDWPRPASSCTTTW